MRAGAGQTPLSEFLRHGATGASGTVTEPLAIPNKFPLAMIHVHYARGCTLAEAFYQSVYGPCQLLIVDGLRTAACKPGEPLALDTTKLADGHHELRIVAVEAGLIQSQGRRIVPVVVDNHGRKLEASITPQGDVRADAELTVTAKCPGAPSIAVFQNDRPMGTIRGAEGRLKIPAAKLGVGPVRLQAVARLADNPPTEVAGPPLAVTVVE